MHPFIKWTLIVVTLLMAVVVSYGFYSIQIMNPRVVEEITTNPDGERAGIVALLTLPDGKELPINYLREGNQVFLGADGGWWRAFTGEGAKVSLIIRGERLTGHARVVLDDPDYTDDVFARLRPKAPAWLPDWLNGKLIVITLENQ